MKIGVIMDYQVKEVLSFLTYLAEKGFLPNNTAIARKAACNNFFELLNSDEEKSVIYVKENLEILARQLENKNPEKFTGSTLETYKSRVSTSLNDFLSWKEDKKGTEEKIAKKGNPKVRQAKSEKKDTSKKSQQTSETDLKASPDADQNNQRKLYIPIRPDFNISVTIPKDLTKSELRKFGVFLFPYCTDFSEEDMTMTNWLQINQKL